jgi:vitamin B12 transporter
VHHRYRGALAALTAFLVFGSAAARADSPAPQPSPAPSAAPADIGRVSTSDRHDEPLDRTTRPTFIVTQAQMDARGDRTIADALVGVPGVQLFRYGAFGAQANVTLLGASSQNVLVMIDGIPANPSSNGQLDVGSLSSVGVRRIEIVEGGGSTLYGASAVGGVINIITDVPRGTYLEAASGSFGENDLRASAGNGSLGVSFERHVAQNDFGYLPQPGTPPSPSGTRTNADAEQSAARIAYTAQLGPNLSARVRLDDESLRLGVPGSFAYGLTPDARQNVSRDDLHLDLTYGTARASTVLTLSGTTQRLAYADPQNPPENDTIDGRSQISLREILSNDQTTLVTGVDLVRESALLTGLYVAGPTANSPPSYATLGEAQSEAAAYVQAQYAGANGFRAYAGLRGENDAPLGGVIAPGAGTAFLLAPGLRLAFNANSAFRTPTIIDRYYPGYANPNLKPERSTDGDITLQDDAVLGGASIGWFVRQATNLIQLDSNYVPQNVAQAALNGFISTIRTKPMNGIVTSLSVSDTYRALDYTGGAAATRLANTPVFGVALGLERTLRATGIGFGVQANLMGPHVESAGPNPDGQTTVDAYVRTHVAPRAILSLRARNLGNERYEEVLGYPAPGRSFALELSTR